MNARYAADLLASLRRWPGGAWVVAVAVGLGSLVAQRALDTIVGLHAPFVVAFPAITLAAWYGGLWPGLLTLAIALAGTLEATLNPQVDPPQALLARFTLFTASSVLICVLCEQLRRARRRADAGVVAERNRKTSEQRLSVALQASPISVYDVDLQLRFTYVHNPAPGLAIDTLIGKSVREVFGRRPARALTELAQTILRTGEAVRTEFPYRWQGKRYYYDLVVMPLQDPDGRIVGFTNATIDITERKRTAERLRRSEERAECESARLLQIEQQARVEADRANRMKDDFLATVSHELRTPLNAVVGWAQLLSMRPYEPERFQKGLDAIIRSARTQVHLIDDLLDMTAIISGKLPLELQAVDVVEVIERARETVDPVAGQKQVRLSFATATVEPILADPGRLKQVFWNLLTNAVKFTPEGGEVRVAIRGEPDGVAVSVTDTGIGIDPAMLPHVFDRFMQIDGSTRRGHGGLGLGLAIARQLVELHHGRIDAASDGLGHGTTFTVSLPARPPEALRAKLAAPPPTFAPELTGTRVLVADQDAASRTALALMLERYGADVLACASSDSAIALLSQHELDDADPIDAIVAGDVSIAQGGGKAILDAARAMTAHASTPAIAITAFTDAMTLRDIKAAGFDAVVTRPVAPSEVASVVAGLLRRKRL